MPNPYGGFTSSSEVVATYILNLLKANAVPLGVNGTKGFYYGDQTGILPVTPAVCVVPGSESSSYNGVGGRPVVIVFQTFVVVYYAMLQDRQANVHGGLTLANLIKNTVHPDFNLGGNVIDCFAASVEPGVAVRGNALYDASRIVFRSRSKVLLNP